MDVYFYKYDPHFNGKTGKRIKNPIVNQEIKQFENILIEVLKDLSLKVKELSRFDVEKIPPRINALNILFHGDKLDYPNIDLFYMQMHLKTQFQLNKSGWGVANSELEGVNTKAVDETKLFNSAFIKFKKELAKHGTKLPKRGKIYQSLPDNDYILVALQTPADTVIKKYSKLSVTDLISQIRILSKKTNQNFLIKLHPNTVTNKKILFSLACNTMFRKNVKIYMGDIAEAIENSSGVIVINSGVGFEALLRSKPVFTLGKADYSSAAYCENDLSLEEWCDILPVKSPTMFFDGYLKYNMLLSDQSDLKCKLLKIITDAIKKNEFLK